MKQNINSGQAQDRSPHQAEKIPAILGTLEKDQRWDDFKARLMASLIRQGVIKEDANENAVKGDAS